jgi:hypothetical protein
MSTPNKYAPSTNIPPPRCPHCGQDIAGLGCYQWSMNIGAGLMQVFAVYCPNSECRKIINTTLGLVAHAEEQSNLLS